MYKFRKGMVSVYTILDRRRRKNSGDYPVKIEVIFRRKQKYYPTGTDVSEEEWNTMWQSKRPNSKCIEIERTFNRIRDEVESMTESDGFSFIALDYRLGRSSCTVNGAFKDKLEELQRESRINSYYRYRTTLRNIEIFAGKDIRFDDVTPLWLKKCEKHWLDSGKNATTVNIYMKTLKTVFNDAVNKGYLKKYSNPFALGKYEMPQAKKRTMALDKKHIELIINYKGEDRIEMYRDLWLFSYLCNGINFMDMIFLKFGNIVNGEIVFMRSKTRHALSRGREIRAALSPKLMEIIKRWGNRYDGNPDTYIFRFAKGKITPADNIRIVREVIYKTNNALDELSSILGIPTFTTYSARHSFATILKKGGADIRFISESLGHTSLKMTENYLAGFDCDERKRYSEILTDFKGI